MKVTCDREKLLHAFQTAASVAPARSPKPILQNVKLEVRSDGATLMATDLEIGIRIDVPGLEVSVPGSVVLPISRFGSILRESSDEKLYLESDGRSTLVRGQRSEFRLPSENPDEFPSVNLFAEERYHELPHASSVKSCGVRHSPPITRAAATLWAACSWNSARTASRPWVPMDAGSRTRKVPPKPSVAGSPRSRGSRRAKPGSGEAMTIVPSRAMNLLDKALADNEEEIQVAARGNDILVKSGKATIYSRLVEGRFPRWRDVFPRRDDPVRIELITGPFYATVRQAAIVASEERRGVDFTFGEGKVVLACRGAEKGESRVELPVAYDGSPRTRHPGSAVRGRLPPGA